MANQDLLERVFLAINQENLNMGSWAKTKDVEEVTETPPPGCGTTMCFAGHAAVLAGHELDWYVSSGERWDEVKGDYVAVYYWTAERVKDGRAIQTVAREELNITAEQADAIFMSTDISDVDTLRNHVDRVLYGGIVMRHDDYLESLDGDGYYSDEYEDDDEGCGPDCDICYPEYEDF